MDTKTLNIDSIINVDLNKFDLFLHYAVQCSVGYLITISD